MQRKGFRLGRRMRRLSGWAVVLCLFAVAESRYRRAWMPESPTAADSGAADTAKPVALPGWLNRFLERQARSKALRSKLVESRDLQERVALWLELAELRGGFRRTRMYQRIVHEAGTYPDSLPAYAFLLETRRMSFERFFQMLREVPPEKRLPFYELGWAYLQRRSHPEEGPFLRSLAADAMLAPSLENAYRRLESMAYRNEDDLLAEQADVMAQLCRYLRRRGINP